MIKTTHTFSDHVEYGIGTIRMRIQSRVTPKHVDYYEARRAAKVALRALSNDRNPTPEMVEPLAIAIHHNWDTE